MSGKEIFLIDLNKSFREGHVSLPILPLSETNSGNENNISKYSPCDSAVWDVNDPFEFVSMKVREFRDGGKHNISDRLIKSEVNFCTGIRMKADLDNEPGFGNKPGIRNELGIGNKPTDENDLSENQNEILTETDKSINSVATHTKSASEIENHIDSGICESHITDKPFEGVDLLSDIKRDSSSKSTPEIICDIELHHIKREAPEMNNKNEMKTRNKTSALPSQSNANFSPEITSVSPKYSSTPMDSLENLEKNHQEEYNPEASKRVELDLNVLSPASMVRIRVEKCIAETEENFKRRKEKPVITLGEKLKCKKSLDSQLSQHSCPYYLRDKSFRCDQNLSNRYSFKWEDSVMSVEDIRKSLKSLQRNVDFTESFSSDRLDVQDPGLLNDNNLNKKTEITKENELTRLGDKLKCRRSLDTQLSQYSSSSCRGISFRCDQNLTSTSPLKYKDSLRSLDNAGNSLKSLQTNVNSTESFSSDHLDAHDPELLEDNTLKDKSLLIESNFVSVLFKASSQYNGHCLVDESVITFIESDDDNDGESAEENSENLVENKKEEQKNNLKRKKIEDSRKSNLKLLKTGENSGEDQKYPGLSKGPAKERITPMNQSNMQNMSVEKSSKSIMSKMLGKIQQFSPKSSISTTKHRRSFIVPPKALLQPPDTTRNNVPRSRSDSTLEALQKKERMLQTSKCNIKETARLSNMTHIPSAARTTQAKHSLSSTQSKVNKPSRPLSQMLQSKKNLLSGKVLK